MSKPHDNLFREVFSDPQEMESLLRSALPQMQRDAHSHDARAEHDHVLSHIPMPDEVPTSQ